MARIDRRGFLTGLGALLGTTALVKPQLPPIEAVTSTVAWDSVPFKPAGSVFYSIQDGDYVESGIGRYLGMDLARDFVRLTPEELCVGMSIRRGTAVIPLSEFFDPDSE